MTWIRIATLVMFTMSGTLASSAQAPMPAPDQSQPTAAAAG